MKRISAGLLILFMSISAKSQVKVGFEVSFTEPQAHYAEMEMNISGLVKDYIDVKMPVWAPGSYLVREFAKSVEGFSAAAGGKTVPVEKIRKNTWRVYSAKAKSIKIRYRVYAFEVSVRTPFIDESHAFLSSTGIFMYPDGLLNLPSTVKVNPFKGWGKVSTGLEPVAGEKFTYTASNFDILFDSPIEVGNQDVFEFMASGVKHEVAMYGGGNYDKERLKVDMAKVVEQATAIYGENPNKHYTFIVHNFNTGGGGLEHLNSTVLGASRRGYTNEKTYKGFLELVAHEYHHLWNVKRLRPIALGPFDYDNENYTTNLWVAEGFTSYFENKLMFRAGFNTMAQTIQSMATAVAGVVNTPGAKIQTVAEASYDAWIKSYRPNENSSNTTISYYSKGEIVGMLMDLEIIQATKGAKNLDDVMKTMYAEYYKKLGRGYTDAEFKTMVEKISGISFTEFWKVYVNGTDPIDYTKYFGYAGVTVKNENEGKSVPYLGVASKITEGKVMISSVSRNSAAWDGGLNVNDRVLSVDEIYIDSALERNPAVTGKKVGESVVVRVLRDGIVKDFKIALKANPNIKLLATLKEDATEAELKVRNKWLK
ncbi:M61 family metallopeptidase [Pedobacter metabolipauper]|uniref:Putative metalloprotease with PDZ domain n=1 Tax=Pedobacter metabolipauper TaxID=425513 RepID=A0A4R6SZM7_9SPHI|nr:PDZ domain-containing protein [Pedobacter metabolipauper]TDQ10154.1 putative metalloprotease with PDZ domain [Pedobacter metabolipauper]